eukprot:13316921-Ditylum_brightwellii.AAC.1
MSMRISHAPLFNSSVRRDIYKVLLNPWHPHLGVVNPFDSFNATNVDDPADNNRPCENARKMETKSLVDNPVISVNGVLLEEDSSSVNQRMKGAAFA